MYSTQGHPSHQNVGVSGQFDDQEYSSHRGRSRPSSSDGKRLKADIAVALIAALVGGLLSLAGVYWQSMDADRHMRREAVEKFLDEYAIVQVELQYFGDRRIPVRSLSEDDRAEMRKQVHGVYGACARLVLVVPALVDPATNARDALTAWEKAISDPARYDRDRQDGFVRDFNLALASFLEKAKAELGLP
jgi:hypothetical protein